MSRTRKLKIFGIVTYKDPDHKVMYSYGTLVGIISESPIARSDTFFSSIFSNSFGTSYSNEWQLVVIGVERFKILSMTEENGVYFASIQIEKDKEEKINDKLLQELKSSATSCWNSLNLSPGLQAERENYLATEKDPALLGFYIADTMDIPVSEKQGLLENFNLTDRTTKIIKLSSSLISESQLTQEISSKIKDDLASKFPQQKSAGVSKAQIDKLEEKLLALELQPETKSYFSDELSRLKSMPKEHPEYNMIRNYLELAASLPWNTSSPDNYDIPNARAQLDSDHFGLEKVKKRIIEYIAVRGLRGDMKGSILCFTGPPGVGKTSMGKSIAASIGRKFFRISLGGVRDEAEIRGHRRTYIGSLPGVLITALKRCGTNNPVILLDEIDKVGTSARGDPASALLEVLDPAQNSSFVDHFLSVPFDLSKVLFLATANHPELIPGPLLDRMEQIEITGYSIHEKVKIAASYLVPKQIKENGLKVGQIEIPDKVVSRIIEGYTRESGVRQLERNIGAVCRWNAVKQIASPEKSVGEAKTIVVEGQVEEILGIPLFENDLAERMDLPGTAIGMAWTSYGGKIMIVETSKSAGHGGLKITGKLGDVMKESVLTAISWIKARLPDLIPRSTDTQRAEGLDGIDLHIHFPAAAVPKDGPTAGITITTALVSLLSGIKVRSDLAMTGEISLTGKVLPIGGLKEKVLGAHRAGIKKIVLPHSNRKDIQDIPDYIQKELTFIVVKKITEVLNVALEDNQFTSALLLKI